MQVLLLAEQDFDPPSHLLSPSVGMFISKIFSSTLNIIEISPFQRIKHRKINIYIRNMLAGVNKWVVVGSFHAAMISNSYIIDIKWTVLINFLLAWYLWGVHSQSPTCSWEVFDSRGLLGIVSQFSSGLRPLVGDSLSSFLLLCNFNAVPHVVVTLTHKVIPLLLHNCNCTTAMNHNIHIWGQDI